MSRLDQKTLQTMNTLANGYANERVEAELDALEALMKGSNNNIVYSREAIKKHIGKLLAIGYSKGYADCFDRIGPQTLIF